MGPTSSWKRHISDPVFCPDSQPLIFEKFLISKSIKVESRELIEEVFECNFRIAKVYFLNDHLVARCLNTV